MCKSVGTTMVTFKLTKKEKTTTIIFFTTAFWDTLSQTFNNEYRHDDQWTSLFND